MAGSPAVHYSINIARQYPAAAVRPWRIWKCVVLPADSVVVPAVVALAFLVSSFVVVAAAAAAAAAEKKYWCMLSIGNLPEFVKRTGLS